MTDEQDPILIEVDRTEIRRVLANMPYGGMVSGASDIADGRDLINWLTAFQQVMTQHSKAAQESDQQLAEFYQQQRAIRSFLGIPEPEIRAIPNHDD